MLQLKKIIRVNNILLSHMKRESGSNPDGHILKVVSCRNYSRDIELALIHSLTHMISNDRNTCTIRITANRTNGFLLISPEFVWLGALVMFCSGFFATQ